MTIEAVLGQQQLSLVPTSPALGADIYGVDLSQPLSEAHVAEIRAALLQYKVLCFPNQNLTPAAHSAMARQFGEPTAGHPVMAPLDPRYPEIWEIDSSAEAGATNDIWHTDVTFVKRPPLGSILRAIRLPEVGGDTSWGCLEAAYNSLSAPMQAVADQLTAVHDGTREFAEALARRNGKGNEWEGEVFERLVPTEHPVVRIHPDSGRKSLFVNPGFTTHIKGVSDAESQHLLGLFFAHITKPEHTIRHRWSHGDVIFWDNRSTVHYANDDYGDFRRIMQRITLRGDEPVGPQG